MSPNRFRPVFVGGPLLALIIGWPASAARTVHASQPPPPGPTFTRDVAPILYKNCTSCHRAGEIGPMSLITYREVRPWAKAIGTNVSARNMPPWFADPQFGKFHNARRLSDKDVDTITSWVNHGAPEGNPADLPPPPRYAEGWTIKPDAVFEMADEFSVPADGTINYKYFDVPTKFTEDKWVQAVEVRAGDRAHVHHVIVYYQEPTPTQRPRVIQVKPEQARTPTPAAFAVPPGTPVDPTERPSHPLGLMLAAVATGTDPAAYPEGVAIKVPAGANLTFQIHYTSNGAPGKDRTSVGLVFAKKTPERELRSFNLINGGFTIPAGESNYRVDAEATFTDDVTVWTILPHTHLRGRRFEYRAVYPDGKTETILSVPKYDFSWQTDYAFDPPLKFPKGTRLEAAAFYDNSPNNPSNPNPSATVKWGDQTWEEMMFTAIRYTVDGAKVTPTASEPPKAPGGR